jgi:uncharacterized tellurite resistance protein B-like protein
MGHMINRVLAFLGLEDGQADAAFSRADEKYIAAAALMVEAATLDGNFAQSERDAITALVKERFRLSVDETATLIKEAEAAHGRTNNLLTFTRIIKDRFDEPERIEIMEMLWEVAYADGKLHDYEANLMRRIGGLIYVSDRDNGAARKRAMQRTGVAD